MPGSVAVITAQSGKVEMEKQGGILDVKPAEEAGSGSKLTKDERAPVPVVDRPRHAETRPIIPTSRGRPSWPAAIVGKRWKRTYDGVIAVDPVTLSYMLNGIGPVDVGDGVTINSPTPSRPCSTGCT